MAFPWQLSLSIARYVAANKLRGRRRFPLVLMLEPTLRCNLACAGCGRIREDRAIGSRMLSVHECLAAVEESGAPVVSIAGGEPLLHPEIGRIVAGIVGRGRFVYLCTNGIALRESLPKFSPNPRLSFVFHVDGLAPTHDGIAGRRGVFDMAIAGIEAAKKAGFQVRTNTTVFKGTDPKELLSLFDLLSHLGVDGMMVAPAFGYEDVEADIFLSRAEVPGIFRPIYERRRCYRIYHSSAYLEFLAGRRALRCAPWSTPTRNPRGWKTPCYLITDGYCESFRELMEETEWEKYGAGNDPRCENCMVHSGFEASAIGEATKSLPDLWHTLRSDFLGG